MKKILGISFALVFGIMGVADAATARGGARGGAGAGAATKSSASAGKATAARAAARTPAAAKPTSGASKTTAARAAVQRGGASGAKTTSSSSGGGKVVAARAGAMQKVVGGGTKVAAASKNVVVSEACQEKYDGCMDSFCMLDNDTGGRCLCSDKNAEYDSILAEIEKLDQQSYAMATTGVERIEMGDDASAAIANANAVANSLKETETTTGDKKAPGRRTLDLSLWDDTGFEEESVFEEGGETSLDAMAGKEGDALHTAAANLCAAQIPECKAEMSMLQLMYAQRVKSDCAAYENSLKQQKNASAKKLAAAEKALRDAALTQLRDANKYDLGQCTIEFKKCMTTTAGCGSDFAQCASVNAMENTNATAKKSKTTSYKIQGAVAAIEISPQTYDTLIAKKPLCESVTKQCKNVASQVWDTFLREVAPQLKSAELIAEDNARQDCIGNISSCFQKACKDTMDPKDPDGSYDMCLSRPGTMLNVCKIPLNNCGIDATSESAAEKSNIWEFVVARLASMRVDSCTTAVKECLLSDDRCGKDYAGCIGLDTDTIIKMCPYDKLTGCQKKYGDTDIRGDKVYEELYNMVQGIMLNIDNNMLAQCQKAADAAMVKVCGDTTNCDALTVDDNIGARSLEYKICEYTYKDNSLDIDYGRCRTDVSQITDKELGRDTSSTDGQLGPVTPFAGVLDGTIFWESVDFDDEGKLTLVDDYLAKIDGATNMSAKQKERVKSELAVLQKNIDVAVAAIEADPTVQFCMTGREVDGVTKRKDDTATKKTVKKRGATTAEAEEAEAKEGRFPGITKQMRMIIATSALKVAKDNYYKKYDELNDKMMQDYAKLGERMAEIQGQNALDARREFARQACVNFSEMSAMAKSKNPPKNAFGKVLAAVAIAGAAVAIPFTGGASVVAISGLGIAMSSGAVSALAIGGAAATVATIGLAGNAGSKGANGEDSATQLELVGNKKLNQWNYKETITSTFAWDTLVCHKCTRVQQCTKTKNPLFGDKYCKTWADPVESCTDTQF